MKSLILSLAMLLPLAACATPQPVGSTYYVVRHFDTPEGQRDPDLLPVGRARAERLATMLADAPPRAIYVSDFKRTRQSAAPIAAKLGLTPKLYDPADTPGLTARVTAEPGPVLIVGHSNTVPDVIAALGGERPGPLVHADFGDVWTIRGGATLRVKIVP